MKLDRSRVLASQSVRYESSSRLTLEASHWAHLLKMRSAATGPPDHCISRGGQTPAETSDGVSDYEPCWEVVKQEVDETHMTESIMIVPASGVLLTAMIGPAISGALSPRAPFISRQTRQKTLLLISAGGSTIAYIAVVLPRQDGGESWN